MEFKPSSKQSRLYKSASSGKLDVVQTEAKAGEVQTVKGAESSEISNERSDAHSRSSRLGIPKIRSLSNLGMMCRTSDALSPEHLSSPRTHRKSQDSSQRSERSVDSGSGSRRKRLEDPLNQDIATSSSDKRKNRQDRKTLVQENESLKSQVEQANHEKETLAQEKQRLESQNKDLNTQAQGKDVLMAVLLSRFEQAHHEKKNLEKQIDTVSQQQRELEHHLNQVLQEKDLLQHQHEQELQDIERLRKQNNALESQVKDHSQTIKGLNQQNNDLLQEHQKKQQDVERLKKEIEKVQSQLTQSHNEKGLLQQQYEQNTQNIDNLHKEIKELKLQHLEEKIRSEIEETIFQTVLRAQLSETQEHLTQAHNHNQQEVNNLRGQVERANQEKTDLAQRNQNLMSDVEKSQELYKHSLQKIEDLTQQIKDLDTHLNQAHQGYSDLQQQDQQKQREINNLNKEKEHLESQLAQARAHHSDLERQSQQKQQGIKRLIENLQSRLIKAHQDINQLNQQKEALLFVLQNRLERAEQQKADLNQQIRELDHQLDQQHQEFLSQFDIKWSVARSSYDNHRKNQEKKYIKDYNKELYNENTHFTERCKAIIEDIRSKYENEKILAEINLEKEKKQEKDKATQKYKDKINELKQKFSDHNSEEYQGLKKKARSDSFKEIEQIKRKFALQSDEKMAELARKSRAEIDKQIEILNAEHQAKIEKLEKEYNDRLEYSRQIWDEGREKLKTEIREQCEQEFNKEMQMWLEKHQKLDASLKKANENLEQISKEKDKLQRECDSLRQKLTKLELNSKYFTYMQSEDDIDDYLKRHLPAQQEITQKMRRSLSAMVSLDKLYWGEKMQDDTLPLSYPPHEVNSRSEGNMQLPYTLADNSNISSISSEKSLLPIEATQKDKGKQIIGSGQDNLEQGESSDALAIVPKSTDGTLQTIPSDAARGDLIPISESKIAQLADRSLRQNLRPADNSTSSFTRYLRGAASLVNSELHKQQVIESTQEELVLYNAIAKHLLERGKEGVNAAFKMAEEKFGPEINKLQEELTKCEQGTTDYDIAEKKLHQARSMQTLYRKWMITEATHTKSKLIAMSTEVNRQAQSFGATSKLTEILNKISSGTSDTIPYYGRMFDID